MKISPVSLNCFCGRKSEASNSDVIRQSGRAPVQVHTIVKEMYPDVDYDPRKSDSEIFTRGYDEGCPFYITYGQARRAACNRLKNREEWAKQEQQRRLYEVTKENEERGYAYEQFFGSIKQRS